MRVAGELGAVGEGVGGVTWCDEEDEDKRDKREVHPLCDGDSDGNANGEISTPVALPARRDGGRGCADGTEEEKVWAEGGGLEDAGGGWLYASGFPTQSGRGAQGLLPSLAVSSRARPLDFVRWRRWLRRQRLRVMERRVVQVEAGELHADKVGEVDVRRVPGCSLAICNLASQRLFLGIYVPEAEEAEAE